MIVFKRKQVIASALVVMIGIAGYLNYKYDEENATATNELETANIGQVQMVSGTQDYFSNSRMNREDARAKAIDLLKDTIANENVSNDTKNDAQKQILDIAKNIESEENIESIIIAKGFSDAVVFINGESVTVTVKTNELTAVDTAKIKDVVMEYINTNNIKIVEVE